MIINNVKDMINSMFFHVCRCLVLSNKGGNSIEEKIDASLNAQSAYKRYSQLKNAMYKAYLLNFITETEYKFVLRALKSVVNSEMGLHYESDN